LNFFIKEYAFCLLNNFFENFSVLNLLGELVVGQANLAFFIPHALVSELKTGDSNYFSFSFLFSFPLFFILELRVRVSITSHYHIAVTYYMTQSQLWLPDHMLYWKDIEDSGRIMSYNIYNTY